MSEKEEDEAKQETRRLRRQLTIPGHELEFVDELDARNEEGQSFTAACLCRSQDIPAEWSKRFHVIPLPRLSSSESKWTTNPPSLQQRADAFVLDLGHVLEAHALHSLQRVLANYTGERGKGCVLERP